MIRGARLNDIPAFVELARAMHASSVYRDFVFSEQHLAGYLAMALDAPSRYCILVAEHDHRLVGFLAGYLESFVFGPETIAYDTAFYVAPEHRGTTTAKRLIAAFRAWAIDRGAREIGLGISTGIDDDRVGGFYERLGWSRSGVIYKQRLDHG